MSLLETLLGSKINTLSQKPSPTPPVSPTSGDAGGAGDIVPKRDFISEHAGRQVTKRYPTPIPSGAILLAPRYDGIGKPLTSIPKCWCCKAPYQLERLQEWKGQTYAWLERGCGCLNAPQALACCGLCVEHCKCKVRTAKAGAQKASQDVFRTAQTDGDSQ